MFYLSKNSEVLTPDGWLKAEDIQKNSSIIQYSESKKALIYDAIENINKKFSKEIISFEAKDFGVETHPKGNIVYDNKNYKALALVGKDIYESKWPLMGGMSNQKIDLPDAIIKLIVWVVGDATLIGNNESSKSIQFKLSRPEKISRLESLLKELKIDYKKSKASKSGENKKQPYYLRITGQPAESIYKILDGEKEYPEFLRKCDKDQIRIFIEELKYVDGSEIDNGILLTSSVKDDIDKVQELCTLHGIISHYKGHEQGKEALGDKTTYKLYIVFDRPEKDYQIDVKNSSYNDYIYIIDSNNNGLVTRTKGKVGVLFNE